MCGERVRVKKCSRQVGQPGHETWSAWDIKVRGGGLWKVSDLDSRWGHSEEPMLDRARRGQGGLWCTQRSQPVQGRG